MCIRDSCFCWGEPLSLSLLVAGGRNSGLLPRTRRCLRTARVPRSISTGTGTVIYQYRQKSIAKYRKTVYRLEKTVIFRYRRKSTVKFGDTVYRQKWYREKSKYRQPFEKYRHFSNTVRSGTVKPVPRTTLKDLWILWIFPKHDPGVKGSKKNNEEP